MNNCICIKLMFFQLFAQVYHKASIHCTHDSLNTTLKWFCRSELLESSETRMILDNGTLEFMFLIDNVDLSMCTCTCSVLCVFAWAGEHTPHVYEK